MGIIERKKYTDEEKIKAAYALNLCTVSVSQIVDYNDIYILEQEYDAILNNLNLKEMPKDAALLKILTEILNTISFFRIQEIKKKQIEKKYNRKVKNAIWSAVPSLSIITSLDPASIAISLVTQIGTGYMNYRKEKAAVAAEKEDAEIELQITAMEQFNALKRELFTTAWRLADEYDFDDELRLTEKQIKQYNEILTDADEYRKYARLEAVADKFKAYPPFWYFYGHTANYIAEQAKETLRNFKENPLDSNFCYKNKMLAKEYTKKAKLHYEHYYSLCKNNILREDQLTASFALEYVDILWNEESRDLEKIHELLNLAEKMAPNSFDILQFCSISYLKIGDSDNAERLLKYLVNEDYNTITNAKLLSRLYVSRFIKTGEAKPVADYEILEQRVDCRYLYPMPRDLESRTKQSKLELCYNNTQKEILSYAYTSSLKAFERKMTIAFNAILPPARKNIVNTEKYYDYSGNSAERRKEDVEKVLENEIDRELYISTLKSCNFRNGYIDVLNQTICGLQSLSCFTTLESYDTIIYMIAGRLRIAKSSLKTIQEKLDSGKFQIDDYDELTEKYSYKFFTEAFFNKLAEKMIENIELTDELETLDSFDYELSDFCNENGLPAPESYISKSESNTDTKNVSNNVFFEGELLGIDGVEVNYDFDTKNKVVEILKSGIKDIILNPENIAMYLFGSQEFETYFNNNKLKAYDESIYLRKQKAVAIIDDHTRNDKDLVLCVDGVTPIYGNKIRDTVAYDDIKYSADAKRKELILSYPDVYTSKDVDILALNGLFSKIDMVLRDSNRRNNDGKEL